MGEILLVPYEFAPAGSVYCEGQLLRIAEYTPLFALMGSRFGGDGRTTFALPDLREAGARTAPTAKRALGNVRCDT